eukprot:TRINITY_DN2050_c0_g1_i4.p1 TRINITY_DN2050_c0_g1~~TRINITY_DN2050_c0_g1_i4.p1  ORF type:complete len:262 (-),score=53.78 TRINITY_DN2050_c0_g1_i4:195-953(-)
MSADGRDLSRTPRGGAWDPNGLPGGKKEEWMCSNCTYHNFHRNDVCKKCGAPYASGVPLSKLTLEVFLSGYEDQLEDKVRKQLQELSRFQLLEVFKGGSLKGSRDVNGVLIKRMVKAYHGSQAPSQDDMWAFASSFFSAMKGASKGGGESWGGGKGDSWSGGKGGKSKGKGDSGSSGKGDSWSGGKGDSWSSGKGDSWGGGKGDSWSSGKGDSWGGGKGDNWSGGKGDSWSSPGGKGGKGGCGCSGGWGKGW